MLGEKKQKGHFKHGKAWAASAARRTTEEAKIYFLSTTVCLQFLWIPHEQEKLSKELYCACGGRLRHMNFETRLPHPTLVTFEEIGRSAFNIDKQFSLLSYHTPPYKFKLEKWGFQQWFNLIQGSQNLHHCYWLQSRGSKFEIIFWNISQFSVT